MNGIHVLEDCDYLLIHDGARPLVTSNLVQAVCEDALQYGASAAAVRVKDTCKPVDEEGFVLETPPREKLMSVQTPQAFERALYLYAAERAASSEGPLPMTASWWRPPEEECIWFRAITKSQDYDTGGSAGGGLSGGREK